MIDELERMTRERYDGEDDAAAMTPLDMLCDWVASGQTIVKLCDELEERTGHEYDTRQVTRYLERYGDVQARLTDARAEGAHNLIDNVIELVENSSETNEAQAKVRNQVSVRQWVAERWNRGAFGAPKQGVNVQLNIGAMFLDSFRRRTLSEGANQAAQPRAFVSTDTETARYPSDSSAIAGAIAEHVEIITDDESSS